MVDLLQRPPVDDKTEEAAFWQTRRRLQQATFEMDQHFVSDFLLLDGRTANLDAVHHVKHRGAIRTFLRKHLKPWESAPMARFRGNDIEAGECYPRAL